MHEDWEDKFDEVILGRGLDYFLSGRVDIINQDSDEVYATVYGTSDYQVEIKIADRRIHDMSCTCPYADDGENCKHMAAVLYALKTPKPSLEPEVEVDETTETLQEIIEAMSEVDVKNLLLAEAEDNSSLRNFIRNFYGAKGVNIDSLKREALNIERRHADRYDYIDYYHASDYARDMEVFMEQYLRPMIRRQDFELAFELVCYIYHSLGELQIDDSNGEITRLSDACLFYLEEIIKKCSLDNQWAFFNWFKEHLYDWTVDYLQCNIDDFFFDNFRESEMLKQKLDILDRLIAKASLEPDDAFSLEYNLERYVLARLNVMNELKMPEEAIDAICEKYYRLPEVRQFILARLLEQEKMKDAIKLLEDSKHIDHNLPGLLAETSLRLMQLYQQTGQKRLYRQELEDYIAHCRQDNLDYVYALKELCTKSEWQQKRQELLKLSTLCGVRNDFMVQEGMHEQLLAEIRSSLEQYYNNDRAISVLDKYRAVLLAKSPEKVRDLYVEFVRKNSELANGRYQYQMLVRYLLEIRKMPAGEEIVQQVVSEWRTVYSRRRTMMGELKKAGF